MSVTILSPNKPEERGADSGNAGREAAIFNNPRSPVGVQPGIAKKIRIIGGDFSLLNCIYCLSSSFLRRTRFNAGVAARLKTADSPTVCIFKYSISPQDPRFPAGANFILQRMKFKLSWLKEL